MFYLEPLFFQLSIFLQLNLKKYIQELLYHSSVSETSSPCDFSSLFSKIFEQKDRRSKP